MKKILSGNEAIARGAYEYGIHVAAAYPGTPSTELLENIAKYPEIYSEWSVNEKVALEVAAGATFAGARALTAMKHVGLNVAADPFFSMAYVGARAAFVVVTADDPSMHSSQNEQDNRHFARAAKVPCLEPADSQECKDFVGAAIEISESFDTPVLLRTTTRSSHSASVVELGERVAGPVKGYQRDLQRNITLPGHARKMHLRVEERLAKVAEYGETCRWNRVEMASAELGIITSGVAYQYVKEVFPEASVLKLGLTWPLPKKLIRDFAARVQTLYVVEELDPIIETEVRAMGLACSGKDRLPITFEFNPNVVARAFGLDRYQAPRPLPADTKIPGRPPVLCPGCPHRGTFFALKRCRVTVTGDIGCYTLGMFEPLDALDTCVCMGASVTVAHGMDKALGEKARGKIVGVIGDSTFLHSGITGLLDVVYNKGTSTIVILDNSITAMTGHQHNPGTGKTLSGADAPKVDLEALCRACGVKHVRVVDPLKFDETLRVLKEEIARPEPSVVIARAPCVLIDRHPRTAWTIDNEACNECGACLRLGCHALLREGEAFTIDEVLCADCGMCAQVCKPGAISRPKAGA